MDLPLSSSSSPLVPFLGVIALVLFGMNFCVFLNRHLPPKQHTVDCFTVRPAPPHVPYHFHRWHHRPPFKGRTFPPAERHLKPWGAGNDARPGYDQDACEALEQSREALQQAIERSIEGL